MVNKHSSRDTKDKFVQKYLYIEDYYIENKPITNPEKEKELPGIIIIQIL